jgi:uncharacterized protein YfaS (alpha-2-macroglobulin family)
VDALDRGISVTRHYYPAGADCDLQECEEIYGVQAGELVEVRVTLTVPHEMYYLVVEDHFPAGAEALNTSLQTSQQGVTTNYNPQRPFEYGWGWWYFTRPKIYDERIVWMTDFLPAGTYEFSYFLVTAQPGDFQVIPVRAWELYFSEVQGHGEGRVFQISP